MMADRTIPTVDPSLAELGRRLMGAGVRWAVLRGAISAGTTGVRSRGMSTTSRSVAAAFLTCDRSVDGTTPTWLP